MRHQVTNLPLLVSGIQDVARDSHRQRRGRDSRHRLGEPTTTACHIVKIHRLANQQVAVGIESTNKSITVVVEISLDFKLVPQADAVVLCIHVGQVATESIGEYVVAAKRHLGHHARNRQTLPRAFTHWRLVIVATAPLRVQPNRASTNCAPRNLLCR